MPSCILSIVIGSPCFAVFAAQTCGNCKSESGSFLKLSCIWHGSSLSFELGSRNFITRFFSSWVYPTDGRDALEEEATGASCDSVSLQSPFQHRKCIVQVFDLLISPGVACTWGAHIWQYPMRTNRFYLVSNLQNPPARTMRAILADDMYMGVCKDAEFGRVS